MMKDLNEFEGKELNNPNQEGDEGHQEDHQGDQNSLTHQGGNKDNSKDKNDQKDKKGAESKNSGNEAAKRSLTKGLLAKITGLFSFLSFLSFFKKKPDQYDDQDQQNEQIEQDQLSDHSDANDYDHEEENQTLWDKCSPYKNIIFIGGFVLLLIIVISLIIHIKNKNNSVESLIPNVNQQTVNLAGVTTDFTHAYESTALQSNQIQLSKLQKQLDVMQKRMQGIQDAAKEQEDKQSKTIRDLQNQLRGTQGALENINTNKHGVETTTDTNSNGGAMINNASKAPLHLNMLGLYGNTRALGKDKTQGLDMQEVGGAPPLATQQISSFHFSFAQNEKEDNPYDAANFVPTGTFAKAVMLYGADANAGVNSQGDATPVEFQILENGYEPNGRRAPLKHCFVTAGVTGEISSERGIIKLDRLSCTRDDGSVLDIPVEGTAVDIGGKNGIRGIPVMRNGKIIEMSGLSGFLSGVGGALSQASTTTSVSPLGATQTISGSDVLKAGLGQGAQTALGKIADYYIKLAEQYHPIIQINAGAMVDLVFLGGFHLDPKQTRAIGMHTPMHYGQTEKPQKPSIAQMIAAQQSIANQKMNEVNQQLQQAGQ
ncbi:TraB/TrbI/VirB10 family type IV secretion system protein [Fangia hongkongensis]|uniref:TrbI/VirB10 family protein n=2 Tax=Fangia hongkongensis TaxID=270495 RepID=UPI000A07A3C9|nr:TrbI/VirB10 family protein [Fangia hongkongensis]